MHSLMRNCFIATCTLSGAVFAADINLALGDSITFGETDLNYVPSFGDRGYAGRYADLLATLNGGVRPQVINLAIDGETAVSFRTGIGRTAPVVNRTDIPLATQNLNYSGPTPARQLSLLQSNVAAQAALGNTIKVVTITLGFNEVAALSQLPPADALMQIPRTLADYEISYSEVLTNVRALLPSADLFLVGYYNPFPADPSSPAAAIFNAGGAQLNSIIEKLASVYGGSFVDTAAAFVGHEAEYTYLDEFKAGSTVGGSFGGVLPIGNVHPNALGYDVIARQIFAVTAVPEPSSWGLLCAGLVALAWRMRGRRLSIDGADAIRRRVKIAV